MAADHCLHVMHYYDYHCENVEWDNQASPFYDWSEEEQAEYTHCFELSVAYGNAAHADYVPCVARADDAADQGETERYEQTCH